MRRAKKWLGVVSALALTVAMGLNAFAAPSPAAGGAVKNEAVAAVDKNGNKITVGINDNVNADVVADVKKSRYTQSCTRRCLFIRHESCSSQRRKSRC